MTVLKVNTDKVFVILARHLASVRGKALKAIENVFDLDGEQSLRLADFAKLVKLLGQVPQEQVTQYFHSFKGKADHSQEEVLSIEAVTWFLIESALIGSENN